MKISTDSHIKKIPPGVIKLLAILFWIAVWQVGASMVHNSLVLPSPWVTLTGLSGVVSDPDFFKDIGMTLLRVFGGIAVSVLLGITVGMISGLNRIVHELMLPFVTVVRTLPVVSVSILINLWIKSGWVPLMVTFLVCFPITWTNVVEGIHNTSRNLLEMAALYHVPFKRVLSDIYLPTLKPYCASALMNVIGMGWRSTVTSEVLANALPSIGMNLYYAKVYLETETLFSWTLIVVVCSFVLEKLMVWFLRKIKAGDDYGY